jgi:type VI secretion system protein ImpG
MANLRDSLIDYYQRELSYLRKMGAAFAQSYPKVARRLELGPDQSGDPNVERLIESFAFLAARIQRNIEAEFPRFTSALLDLLYPHLTRPTPAMSIAHFDVDPTQGKLTSGHLIPRHTTIFALAEEDLRCRFTTAYPVTLWPVEVVSATIESTAQHDFLDTGNYAAVLRLRLRAVEAKFEELEMERLRFYFHADPILGNALYELLFTGVENVAYVKTPGVKTPGGVVIRPASQMLGHVGFDEDEGALPDGAGGYRSYRLLQEYFVFPEKFRFMDLAFPDLAGAGEFIEVLFLLDRQPTGLAGLNAECFALGCTPIINLFTKLAEPLRPDYRQSEYRLVGDYRRERTTEIHSILSVTGISEVGEKSVAYAPFFSYDHTEETRQQATFWHARREATGRKDMPGTDIYLNFLDLDFRPSQPASQIIMVNTLCTNRILSEQVPAGCVLQIEEAAPLSRITALIKPSIARMPPMDGQTAWRLVSHLSVNHLSLNNEEEGLRAFRELLRLYATGDASAEQQISGIRSMKTRPIVRRVGADAWRGFCRGNEVTLELDERRYVGSSTYLFAAVLNRFLALYATVNSFTQLRISSVQRSGIWKTWPPQAGDRDVL